MKRICFLMLQDINLLLRNALFWIITGTLLIIVLTIHFLIPKDLNADIQSIVTWQLNEELPFLPSVENEQAVLDSVKEKGTVGLIKKGERIILVHSGLSEKAQNALMATLFGKSTGTKIEVRSLIENAKTIPENIRLTPVFICFEALISGFLLAGVLMLEEKESNVIKAYRVSPAGTIAYVVGKALLFSLVGLAYSLLIGVFTVGFGFHWGGFILLSFLSSAFFTLIGILIAIFFKDLSGWFSISVLILSVNMLSMLSYSSPSFSPSWIRFIPSYPIIFAYEDLLFGTGKDIAGTLLFVLTGVIVLFGLSCILVRKKLLQSEWRFL